MLVMKNLQEEEKKQNKRTPKCPDVIARDPRRYIYEYI